MIDTHAHLDGDAFAEDRQSVIERAFLEGVENIIIPAIEPGNFDEVLNIARSNDKIYCGIGIHPHHALQADSDALQLVENLASSEKKVIAIGEIGLDYYYDFAPKDVQQDVFRKQLQIAKRLKLPSIVHNRESDDDLLRIMEEEQDGSLNAVLHCFSGDSSMLEKTLELGFFVSFTGNVTFKKSDLSEIVRKSPIDKIFLETDCPYMTPVPYRGKRNEPSMVKLVAEKIAEIKSLSIEEVIQMTSRQAKKFFKLLAILFLFAFNINFLSAQESDEEAAEQKQDLYHPFEKFIGINPTLGINTIVQSISFLDDGGEKDISYEGIPLFGGGLSYGLLDFLLLKADYIYSKNPESKKQINDPANWAGDDIHQYVELRTIWFANPYSTVNFFASAGGTYIYSVYNKGAIPEKVVKRSTTGLNAGIGLNVNMSLKNYGLLNVMLEWMLHFDLSNRLDNNYIKGVVYENGVQRYITTRAEESTFYSMPRVSLIYYPPFKKQKPELQK